MRLDVDGHAMQLHPRDSNRHGVSQLLALLVDVIEQLGLLRQPELTAQNSVQRCIFQLFQCERIG